jgi:protoporphyrinogen oxidase
MAVTVAVAGAGLAGLAAAWELGRSGADVALLEAARRPGGMVLTERRDGFVIEGGPDGFLAAEPDIPDLVRDAGIGARLVDQAAKGSACWTGTALEPLAEGRAAELLGIDVHQTADLAAGFRSFAGGMGEFVEALVARMTPRLRAAQGVTGLAPAARGWRLSVTGGATLEAEAVILALPAWIAARLLSTAGVPRARELDHVIYHPSTTVTLAYREEQFPRPLEGTGFVSAPEWSGAVRACSYASLKYPGRAPGECVLLRAFVGPAVEDPAGAAAAELRGVLGIRGDPLWTRRFTWSRGIPRYLPGHATHVAQVRTGLVRLRPLAIAGSGFDGAGVSACVRSGRAAARLVLERLAQ